VDRPKSIVGSAPIPPSAQPREPGRLAGFDRWWLLLGAALVAAFIMYVLLGDTYAPIFRFVVGTLAGGDGVFMTLRLTIISFVLIIVVGMLMGILRVSSIKILQGLSSLYVEVVRGIPVLVWLMWIYFGLPDVLHRVAFFSEVRIPDFTAAVVGLTFAYGAYMTEVFRAGIQSIAKGQMEASRSLGMTYIQAMRYIVLPQAVRVILPPMSNEFITLLKDSSLVSILGLADLTRRGREWSGRTFEGFATWLVVALCYLILTLIFTRLSTAIERRLSVEKR
jgi:polar amino acid transport system permease protein